MKLQLTTNPDTGVRELSAAFYRPAKQPEAASALSAEQVPAGNVRTAEPLWTPPPPAKLVVEDESALRLALADALTALADAREAEVAVAARVSVAFREHGAAEGRHAVAVAKTTAARQQAAVAMQAWLQSDDTDARPDSGAVSAAVAVEAAAKVDVEVVESVLANLKIEHENAITGVKKLLREAELIRDKVVFAQAAAMAREVVELEERTLELRLTLSELFLALPGDLHRPAGLREALTPKKIPLGISDRTPGVQRWAQLRVQLLSDAQSTVAPLGD
ncbi:hypothetical protein [Methylobacterium sp. ARG-1]|uniref:hypothetical protein n=1 Tax=Methylobacterium sp. ARG-1 TaxID=1692501 RepID=UPI0006800197|nr:hypothetical protein [Methylobacterium sp. ARG-1]KNY19139.1 hypothetical protein AKJ13_29450 [Methylobacterium sp. ARG-1]